MRFFRGTLLSYYLILWWRSWRARARFDVQVGRLANIENSQFEGLNTVKDFASVANSTLGRGTYVGVGATISRARIGRFCSIGGRARISLGLHPASTFVSTHPAFYSPTGQAGFSFSETSRFEEHKTLGDGSYRVEIGNDVWIGYAALIMDGLTIGDGAIIGAGAVVTHSVEPYGIYAGVPARKISTRFQEDQIDFLLKFRWWDKDIDWIRAHNHLFSDVDQFIATLGQLS